MSNYETRRKSKHGSKKSKKTKKSKKSKTSTCSLNNKCAPGINPNSKTCSCLSRDSLIKIASEWNNSHNDNKITYKPKSTSVYLWKQINMRLQDKCKSDWCWIQQEFVKRLKSDGINDSYRPTTPKTWKNNKYEWLKTDDIENVMNQYEVAYPDFSFIGPVPIDFDKSYGIGHCVVDELCKIDLHKAHDKGFNKFGVIFNLDPHNKPGSHWVSMFCDLKAKGIYYFDSYGMVPPREVDILMRRMQTQAQDMKIKLKIKVNGIRHQYKNSECGVYCLFFISELLRGQKYNKLIKSPILDEAMNKKRQYFFIENQ
jgi:hypothetical protein